MPARLSLINGDALNVLQNPEDAALLLWGHNKGDDAHDKGFATLQGEADLLHVNPATVIYVTALSPEGLDQAVLPDIDPSVSL